jgi:hypothetical protein
MTVEIAKSPTSQQIILTASYNVAVEYNLIEFIRTIQKRYWDASKKKWFLPFAEFDKVYVHLKSLKCKVFLCEYLHEIIRNNSSKKADGCWGIDQCEMSFKRSDKDSDKENSKQAETIKHLRKKTASKRQTANDNNQCISNAGNKYLQNKSNWSNMSTNEVVEKVDNIKKRKHDDNRIDEESAVETVNDDEGETLGESDDDDIPRKEKRIKTFRYIKSKYNLS